ncbi:PAS domain-containing sensor histidine kinase [Flaviaesturariibacter terrae]
MLKPHPTAGAPLSSDPNLTGLFLQAPAMICILEGPELRCTFTNPLFSKLYEGKPLLGRTPREVAPELEGQGYFEMLDSVYATGNSVYGYEFPGVADWNNEGRDTTKYFNLVYAPYQLEGKTAGVMIFGFEVTEQVLARRRAEAAEARIRHMLDALPQMAWTAGADGNVDYVNERWYAYTGQGPDEALGVGWTAVLPVEEKEALLGKWAQSLRDQKPFEAEMRYRRHDGVLRWHAAKAEPIRDETGSTLYWLGISTDIHEQRESAETLERIVSERTLALKRSNDELKQFAYIASHDLKEPLRKILFFTELMRDPAVAASGDHLERIRNSAMRMNDLVEDLLEFSSVEQSDLRLETVDLNQVLAESLQDQELRILESGARIETDTLPVLRGVPHQLLQLFTNLVGNALKYARPATPAELRITVRPISDDERARFPELEPTRAYHSIAFADNGIGFDPQESERVFTLFHRLHSRSAYSGTGVGLALCRKVARAHGGEIYADALPGAGATFFVLLPK